MAQILYWTVYADSVADYANNATDAAKIKNGQDSTGTSLPAGQKGSQTFTGGTATVDASTAASGLTAATQYRVAWTIYDDVAATYGGGTGATYVVFSLPFSSLALEDGTFTITGNAVTLKSGRKLTAAAGSYSIDGKATGIRYGRKLTLAAGSYTLTGNAVTLKAARKLTAAAGSYSIAGQAAGLTYTPAGAYSLTLDAGSYTLAGQATTLRVGRKLTAAAGSYTITGNAAGLTYTAGITYSLTCDAGVYSLTGQAATFRRGYVITAAAGVYTLSGKAVQLSYSNAAQPVSTLPTWYYTPGTLPLDAPPWLARELMSVSRATYGAAPYLQMQVAYTAPAKPRDGMVVLAAAGVLDTNAGVYARIGGAWVQL